jgi:hypothetical protein
VLVLVSYLAFRLVVLVVFAVGGWTTPQLPVGHCSLVGWAGVPVRRRQTIAR